MTSLSERLLFLGLSAGLGARQWTGRDFQRSADQLLGFLRPVVAELGRSERRTAAVRYVQGLLKDEQKILELTAQHEEAKEFNRETIAKGLVNLGRVIDALPDSQRRELLRLLVSRVVVKPWSDEIPGIRGHSIVIAPDLGTRRYSVKISL